MTPQELAEILQQELRESLPDLAGDSFAQVDSVLPPPDLGPGTFLRVTVSSPERGPLTLELPTTLAIGYLADEEAAVDEWKTWLADAAAQLRSRKL